MFVLNTKMEEVLLSTLLVLRHKLHVFHWNVQGSTFIELHNLFQKQYEEVLLYADKIAEYLRTKDVYINGSMRILLDDSLIGEPNMYTYERVDHIIDILIHDFDIIANTVNKYKVDDRSINVILDDIHSWSTKQSWFLKSLRK